MKVAVVGCGNISKNHFNALNSIQDIEIVAAVDIIKERADKKAELYNSNAYTDYEIMLKTEKPDSVHICTPHYLHTQMAVKALKSGCNVLIEKPCSVTVEEANLLYEVQKKTGKQVGVCFQNRYNTGVRHLLEIIEEGKFGSLKGIRAFVTWNRGMDYYSDEWHGKKNKECGGVLINQAIHTIDLMQYLADGCDSVTAHITNYRLKQIEVEDTATIYMENDNGIRCILYATTAYTENSDVIIEACFENGVLRLEGDNLYKKSEDNLLVNISSQSKDSYVGKSYWGHGHSSLISDFYECIRTGKKFSIDAFEGGKAAKIVASCYNSAENNITIRPEM